MNVQSDSQPDTLAKSILRIARLCAALSVAQLILWVGALVNAVAPAIAPQVVIGAASIAALVSAGLSVMPAQRKESVGDEHQAETGVHDGTT